MLDVADEKIGALAEFPHKFEVVADKLLSLWGIRFTIVMNYLAFYTVCLLYTSQDLPDEEIHRLQA